MPGFFANRKAGFRSLTKLLTIFLAVAADNKLGPAAVVYGYREDADVCISARAQAVWRIKHWHRLWPTVQKDVPQQDVLRNGVANVLEESP